MVKFRVICKQGPRELANVDGRPRSEELVPLKELSTVLTLERELERLTGHRWHISLEDGN